MPTSSGCGVPSSNSHHRTGSATTTHCSTGARSGTAPTSACSPSPMPQPAVAMLGRVVDPGRLRVCRPRQGQERVEDRPGPTRDRHDAGGAGDRCAVEPAAAVASGSTHRKSVLAGVDILRSACVASVSYGQRQRRSSVGDDGTTHEGETRRSGQDCDREDRGRVAPRVKCRTWAEMVRPQREQDGWPGSEPVREVDPAPPPNEVSCVLELVSTRGSSG